MTDALGVHVLNGREYLGEKSGSLLLLDVALLHDVVEEVAAGAVLHDDVVVSRRLQELVELGNVWVPELLENLEFFLDLVLLSAVSNQLFIQDFDSYFLTGDLMNGLLDDTLNAFSKCLSEDVPL